MAEAKAEVMEEIEDGRDEVEEEDSGDVTSVRPPREWLLGRDGTPGGLGSCGRGLGEQEGLLSVSPQHAGHRLPGV